MKIKIETSYQLLIRRTFLVMLDISCIILSAYMALATRFEFRLNQIPDEFTEVLSTYGIYAVFVTLIVFWVFRIYSSLWEYAGMEEAIGIVGACFVSELCEVALIMGFEAFLPRSYYVLHMIYLLLLVGSSRALYRIARHKRQDFREPFKKKTRVMVVGAGEAGRALIHEIQNSRYLNQKVCCVIDDSRRKIGRYILGIRIVGDRTTIPKYVKRFDIQQIIITIPSVSMAELRPILDICKETGCMLKTLPGMYQLVNGEVSVSKLRPVNIDDLLGRDEIRVNMDEIMDYVSEKVIMVTGGGGSIGSELCRQIAGHKPKQLVIFDIYENNAYDIQQELRRSYPDLNLVVLIGSVRDESRINAVFEKYRPEIIYHAAAHKHFPSWKTVPMRRLRTMFLEPTKWSAWQINGKRNASS